MNMKLRDKVIVREEDEGWLLYNGDNGALVQVSREAYDTSFQCRIEPTEGYHKELLTWLHQNGFLEIGPIAIVENASASERGAGLKGFFELRSQRSPLNILWAVTPKCNLRCIYCFPDAELHTDRMKSHSQETLLGLTDQIIVAKVLKVILSGGECLLYPGIWEIAERLRTAGLTVTLLSNGAPINNRVAARASALGLSFGVSLDGPDEQTNATTRGAGAFRWTIRGLSILLRHEIPVAILVTVTRHNFYALDRLFALVASLGVDSVTLQDLRPFGTKEIYDLTRLTVTQEAGLAALVQNLRTAYPHINLETSELFLCSKPRTNDLVMQCPAGDHFAYIDFYGDVYPCTALPSFKLGNLIHGDSIVDLWQRSASIHALRELKSQSLSLLPACRACTTKPWCDGGCRGDALFYRGDLLDRPSRCPIEMGLRT
ncbi:MAG: radical SAM protein [Bacteroidota bacterium]